MRHRIVPVLLVGVVISALAGLVAVSPRESEPRPVAAASSIAPVTPIERERTLARASRGRRLAEVKAAEAQARAEAEARALAEAEAAAAAKAEAEAKAAAEAAAAAKAAAKAAAAAEEKAARARTACPVPNATFTDTWGAARSGGRSHQGTDLLAPYGSPVYAVVPGRIRTASSALGGISLYLDGDNGETYFYAHNAANVARTGQRVAAGDLIAKVGSTGNAGGTNHVHFEREVGGRAVNPYDFLRRIC